MNFGEKLSVKKVYCNAAKYILAHIEGYLFLTFFYFISICLPISLGLNSYILQLILLYFLLYFAAGLYYKQQILRDKTILIHATLRFLTAVIIFLISILFFSFCISIVLNFARNSLLGGDLGVKLLKESITWQICEYLFTFLLLITFFLIPSFAFISEISGKSRSIINAYAKTKGNIVRIAVVAFVALLIIELVIVAISLLNPYIAELIYAFVLVFLTIVYFKMYDFFYNIPQTKRNNKTKSNEEKKNIIIAKKSLKEGTDADKG